MYYYIVRLFDLLDSLEVMVLLLVCMLSFLLGIIFSYIVIFIFYNVSFKKYLVDLMNAFNEIFRKRL